MDIAVVILNWNGASLLKTYLPTVLTYSEEAKIYVADNASTDNSLQLLANDFPEVVVLKNTKNHGFAGGYNEALKYVEEDIMVLLNNDVEVTQNWLSSIIDTFKTSNHIAAVQPKIKSISQPHKFDYAGAAGGFIDALGYPYCRGRLFEHIEDDQGQYDDDMEIFWASGACFAVRRDYFNEVGGFDEHYFAHQEEIDLCWRLKNQGYSIWCTPKSEVYHLGGGTLANSNPRKTFLNFRNSLFSLVKNTKDNPTALIFIRMLLDGIAGLRFLYKGRFLHFFAIFEAHISFYKLLPVMIKKRSDYKKKSHDFIVKSVVWQSFGLKIKTFKNLKSIIKY